MPSCPTCSEIGVLSFHAASCELVTASSCLLLASSQGSEVHEVRSVTFALMFSFAHQTKHESITRFQSTKSHTGEPRSSL